MSSPSGPRSAPDTSENTWTPQDAVPDLVRARIAASASSSSSSPVDCMLMFVELLRLLKTQKRTGWIDKGMPVRAAESISDHMYRMSIIAMAVPNPAINTHTCARIALVHDIAEALVGDITPFGGVSKAEKHRREWATVQYLAQLIEPYNARFAAELVELWLDYEEIRTPEARYVKDIDKFELMCQTYEYEQQFGSQYDLHEFYSARHGIVTPEIRALASEVMRQRNAFAKEHSLQIVDGET